MIANASTSLIPEKYFSKNVRDLHSFEVFNPANQERLAVVPDIGVDKIEAVVDRAQEAFSAWSNFSAKERSDILKNWFDLMIQNAERLSQIMTAEQGKPLTESLAEIKYAASFIEWFAEEGKRAYGDIIPSSIEGARIFVEKHPVGVCALITPWNFPAAMITRKVAPALAAGCTVVVKPAEDTPLSAIALAALAEEAGVPEGVINVITTTDSKGVGEALCADKRVRKLSFTGSTAVGKTLMAQSAQTMKKLSLELGGNAPFIVFQDADIDEAVAGAMACKFRNAGQTCVCANRFYVHSDVYDAFVNALKTRVQDLCVGDGMEAGVDVGPLINAKALDKVTEMVKDACAKGAVVEMGGKPHALGGNYFEPTILTSVSKDMDLVCDEIFGPVAPIFKFTDEQDVIRSANDTDYGLAAYFYTRDLSRIWRVSKSLEYGMVGVNSGIISTEVAPFGGVKESGLGREGARCGLDEYMELKYILLSGLVE